MLESLWILLLALIVLVIACPVLRIQHVIAYEYQKGLKYSKGRYTAALDPGQYGHFRPFLQSFPSMCVPNSSPFKDQTSSVRMMYP